MIVGPSPPPGPPAPERSSPDAARRAQLADFLKARRAALLPEDVGITPSGRRRTPGLRREEVAELAGVGLSWYTWLEQGRSITPSVQVLEALARALRLTAAGREHLFTLAGSSVPADGAPVGRSGLDPPIVEIVDALAPHPAYVLNDRFDVLAHNAPAQLVLGDLLAAPPERRNLLLWLFTESGGWPAELRARWIATARANLLDFRAGHGANPADPAFEQLLGRLRASSELFRRWWAEHDVAAIQPTRKIFPHPELGPLRLDLLQTRAGPDLALRLRILVPTDARTRAIFAERFGDADPRGL